MATAGEEAKEPSVMIDDGIAESLAVLELGKQDHIQCLRASEHKYRVWNPSARYVKYRRIIVDWMCEVADEFRLQPLTTHIACRHLDRILSGLDVSKNKLQLVSMCCILVSAKYNEMDDFVPRIDDLNECTNNAYPAELIRRMEVMVLQTLNWSLTVVTPLHILQAWREEGIVFPETDVVGGGPCSEKAVRYARKYSDFFSELCLQEHAFQIYLPSMLAASIIACSRQAIQITPVWNERLETLTGYTLAQIDHCFQHIFGHYQASFPTKAKPGKSPKDIGQAEGEMEAKNKENVAVANGVPQPQANDGVLIMGKRGAVAGSKHKLLDDGRANPRAKRRHAAVA